ncbi:MAG: DUF2917 domain-containing protein [Betaproteobacteria bacterium]
MKTMSVRYSDNAETRLTLEQGQTASTTEAHGLAIECVRGSLWITFENSGRDHVLEPGARMQVNAGGRMVIEAIAPSELIFYRQVSAAIEAPRPAHSHAGCSPEGWRTFVNGMALPRTNFDSAF